MRIVVHDVCIYTNDKLIKLIYNNVDCKGVDWKKNDQRGTRPKYSYPISLLYFKYYSENKDF